MHRCTDDTTFYHMRTLFKDTVKTQSTERYLAVKYIPSTYPFSVFVVIESVIGVPESTFRHFEFLRLQLQRNTF